MSFKDTCPENHYLNSVHNVIFIRTKRTQQLANKLKYYTGCSHEVQKVGLLLYRFYNDLRKYNYFALT